MLQIVSHSYERGRGYETSDKHLKIMCCQAADNRERENTDQKKLFTHNPSMLCVQISIKLKDI